MCAQSGTFIEVHGGRADDAAGFLAGRDEETQGLAREVDGRFVSGGVRAVKPVASRAGGVHAAPAVGGSPP
jgi:hypothetical protein